MKRRGVLFKHVDHPPRGDIEGAACKVVEAINKADDKKTQEEELLILCGAATVHVKKNKTKNDTLIFFMASLVISLLTHKIAHVLLDNSNGGLLNLTSMERYLWVPSIFLSDIHPFLHFDRYPEEYCKNGSLAGCRRCSLRVNLPHFLS